MHIYVHLTMKFCKYFAKKFLQQVVLDFDKTNSLGLILGLISFVVPLVPSGQSGSMTES